MYEKSIRTINGFEGSGHPKWCHWGGQGAQSGAIGDQRGPVERSWAAKVALPVGLVCESYGNRAEIARKSCGNHAQIGSDRTPKLCNLPDI